jgi:UDP-glucuronate 4-epimerase
MKIFLTGAAGFIGFHVTQKLLQSGYEVLGLDNINSYYDIDLKLNRLKQLGIDTSTIVDYARIKSDTHNNFEFIKSELSDADHLSQIIKEFKPNCVIHLAAQAGVRYSLEYPEKYIESNITGFFNVINSVKDLSLDHFIYASSSSVYGLNEEIPFKSSHSTDHPKSIYAASKKSNEMIAHSYSHLYNIPCTGLRLFTVYGPWGRPDMAIFIFTKNILAGKEINVYNNGNMSRDFTYISDIVESIERLIPLPPKSSKLESEKNLSSNESSAPYKIFNIGHNSQVKLMDFIKAIEKHSGKKALINYQEIQAGDVLNTYADVEDLFNWTSYKPKVGIDEGVKSFVEWFKEFYHKS